MPQTISPPVRVDRRHALEPDMLRRLLGLLAGQGACCRGPLEAAGQRSLIEALLRRVARDTGSPRGGDLRS